MDRRGNIVVWMEEERGRREDVGVPSKFLVEEEGRWTGGEGMDGVWQEEALREDRGETKKPWDTRRKDIKERAMEAEIEKRRGKEIS